MKVYEQFYLLQLLLMFLLLLLLLRCFCCCCCGNCCAVCNSSDGGDGDSRIAELSRTNLPQNVTILQAQAISALLPHCHTDHLEAEAFAALDVLLNCRKVMSRAGNSTAFISMAYFWFI
uniref:HDC18824 n=1 Tax=Drosophila melanogaster TaxID=7227 RepID=Q6IID1_DROME|nr:TPA_inf: HDC18824 [Drosophila melanogaster]